MGNRVFVVYDERAMTEVDEAMVMTSGAESLEEAREDAEDFAPCVIYSYEPDGRTLRDERFEEYYLQGGER